MIDQAIVMLPNGHGGEEEYTVEMHPPNNEVTHDITRTDLVAMGSPRRSNVKRNTRVSHQKAGTPRSQTPDHKKRQ